MGHHPYVNFEKKTEKRPGHQATTIHASFQPKPKPMTFSLTNSAVMEHFLSKCPLSLNSFPGEVTFWATILLGSLGLLYLLVFSDKQKVPKLVIKLEPGQFVNICDLGL